MPIPSLSDTVQLIDPHAGNANAGNGGDGYSSGIIDYSPSASISDTQTVVGAGVDVHNGDHVNDWASWSAGHAGSGGEAEVNAFLANAQNYGSGGNGGNANSGGSQTLMSGGDVAAVHADTSGVQYSSLLADQHATILAGVGGNGGSGNMAQGGDISSAVVHSDPSTTTTTSTEAVATSFLDSFDFADHVSIDLSHLA